MSGIPWSIFFNTIPFALVRKVLLPFTFLSYFLLFHSPETLILNSFYLPEAYIFCKLIGQTVQWLAGAKKFTMTATALSNWTNDLEMLDKIFEKGDCQSFRECWEVKTLLDGTISKELYHLAIKNVHIRDRF